MDSKHRAELRSLANNLKPVFQLGKQGINENFIDGIDKALTAHELIKFKVLIETCPEPPKSAAQIVAERTDAEVVSVMGGVITLYRYSEELHQKQKEKMENIKKAQSIKRKKAYEELKEQQEKYRKSRQEYQKREIKRKNDKK